MRNSRWNHTFCMSQCYLEQGSWQFGTIELLEKPNQASLRFWFESRSQPMGFTSPRI